MAKQTLYEVERIKLMKSCFFIYNFQIKKYQYYETDNLWSIKIEGEAVQNAAGLGLHFVDGKPEWDLTANVNILKLDVSWMNIK